MLAQWGTYRSWPDRDREVFTLDMTRQFAFSDSDGEHDRMTQCTCAFAFAPTDDLRAVGAGDLWSFGEELDAFFDRALALPGFRVVQESSAPPLHLDVSYSEV